MRAHLRRAVALPDKHKSNQEIAAKINVLTAAVWSGSRTLPPLGSSRTRSFVVRVEASSDGGMSRRLYLVGDRA